MKKTDKFLQLFLYITLVVIGVVAGILIRHFRNITISEEINLIDMATLIVTVFLAVYIPAVLDRRLQSSKEKQDLLVSRINDYQALLRRINVLVQSIEKLSVNEHLTIKNLLDIAHHRLQVFISLMKSANLEGDFSKALEEIKALDDEHRTLLWSDKLGEEGFDYSVEIEAREEELYNKLDEAASLLIFSINDAK